MLANALSSNNTNPLIVQHEISYYVATPNLFDWMSHYVGEMLFSYFSQNQRKIKLKLIYVLRMFTQQRDINQLKEIAKLLKEKKMPYMITVIPVYKDPDTGKIIHLKDKPELVDLLRSMQDDGAELLCMVILTNFMTVKQVRALNFGMSKQINQFANRSMKNRRQKMTFQI